MNKNKLKSARKEAKGKIKADLIQGLKEITGKMGQESKKLSREIEKGSEKLAKRIVKEIKIDKSLLQEPIITAKEPKPDKKAVQIKSPKVNEKPLTKDSVQS